MTSESVKDILATSASICTILQFLAGTLVCRKYIKNGTTGDSSALAFITCYISCSLWLRYGILISDSFVVLVNAFGTLLQVAYIIIYCLFSVKKTATIRLFALATCFLALEYIYSVFEDDRPLAVNRVGLLSCGFTILFFASPLSMLAHVIRVKSAESLPFPVIVATLIVSCQWYAYGCILGDLFIQIPNFMGCILSAFQLSLFLMYPTKQNNQPSII